MIVDVLFPLVVSPLIMRTWVVWGDIIIVVVGVDDHCIIRLLYVMVLWWSCFVFELIITYH